jgi:hypothetical protein
MGQKNVDMGTEWIFCTDINGRCAGVNTGSQIIDKIEKKILVNGEEVQGWMVKIVQEKGEGHLKLDLSQRSDE